MKKELCNIYGHLLMIAQRKDIEICAQNDFMLSIACERALLVIDLLKVIYLVNP